MKPLRLVFACLFLSGVWISSSFGDEYDESTPIDPAVTKDVRIKKWPDGARHNDGTYGWWIDIYNFTRNSVRVHLKVWQLKTDAAGNPVTQGSFDDKWTSREIDLDVAAGKNSGNTYIQHFKQDALEFVEATVTLPGQASPPSSGNPGPVVPRSGNKFQAKNPPTSTPQPSPLPATTVTPPKSSPPSQPAPPPSAPAKSAPAPAATNSAPAPAPAATPSPATAASGLNNGWFIFHRPGNIDSGTWRLYFDAFKKEFSTKPYIRAIQENGEELRLRFEGLPDSELTGLQGSESYLTVQMDPKTGAAPTAASPAQPTPQPAQSASPTADNSPAPAASTKNRTGAAPSKGKPTASEPAKQVKIPHDGYWFDPDDKDRHNTDKSIYVRINGEPKRVLLSVAIREHEVPEGTTVNQMTWYSEKLKRVIDNKGTHNSKRTPSKPAPAYWYDPSDMSRSAKEKFIYVRVDGEPVRMSLDEAQGYGVPADASIETMTHYDDRKKQIVIDRGTHRDKTPPASTNKFAKPPG